MGALHMLQNVGQDSLNKAQKQTQIRNFHHGACIFKEKCWSLLEKKYIIFVTLI